MSEILVVHGAPGSGKTTHAERLTNDPLMDRSIYHISAGDRLRDIRNGLIPSEFQDRAQVRKNHEGESVMLDHTIVNGIVFEYISQCPSSSIILVDGYPRFLDAVSVFLDAIDVSSHTFLGTISLNISLETCIARLMERGSRRGERHITTDFINRRFSDHMDYTLLAIEKLRARAPVIDLDASSEIETVYNSFRRAVSLLTNTHS